MQARARKIKEEKVMEENSMKVGILKDIKVGEYRVIATPAEVSMIASDGHEVYV